LLEPLFWIGTFAGLFAVLGRTPPNAMAVVPFLTTGVIAYQLVIKTAERGSQAINGNKALLFYPQVHTLDLILARGVLELATYGVVFAIIVGGWSFAVDRMRIDDLLMLVGGLGLSGFLGMGLGLVLCGLNVLSPTVERIRGPVFRPLFWLSGLFFTASSLPGRAREILLYNPILHCVELVRSGFFPAYDSRHADASYVMAWIIGLFFVGLTLERKVRHKVQVT
jgi:capsular polysaccharide transport system permease protein